MSDNTTHITTSFRVILGSDNFIQFEKHLTDSIQMAIQWYIENEGFTHEEDPPVWLDKVEKINDLDTFQVLRNSVKTVDMFATLETKDEFDNWLENMPNEMPTGIAVMVGFNYAMRQVQKIMDGTHEQLKETEKS